MCVGEWEVGREVKEQLADLKGRGRKREVTNDSHTHPNPPSPPPPSQYLETVSSVAQFGYRQTNGLTFDHPTEDLCGFARIGRSEIVTYTTEGKGEWGGMEGEGVRCRSYQLTRIRCWKVGYWVSVLAVVSPL